MVTMKSHVIDENVKRDPAAACADGYFMQSVEMTKGED